MSWDLGFAGFGLLLIMAIAFAALAQLLAGRHTTKWMWLVGGVAFFVFGLLISEWWFGWATEEELQPNYDGLSFDETLLALFPSIVVVAVARRFLRHRNATRSVSSDRDRVAPGKPGSAHG